MLKLAIQDLGMHQTKKKNFLVLQQGATCAEIFKCDDVSYVIKIQTKLSRSLRLL